MSINWKNLKERELLYAFAIEQIKKAKNIKNVLDIACAQGEGTVQMARALPNINLVGADNDEVLIAKAQSSFQEKNLEFKIADARRTDFADNSFDALISFHTIEHLSAEDQEAFLKELRRVLKPGGLFLIATPDREVWEIQEIAGTQADHIKELDQKEFVAITRQYFLVHSIFGQGLLKTKQSETKKLVNFLKKLDILKLRKLLSLKLRDAVNDSTQPIELDFTVKPLGNEQKASINILLGQKPQPKTEDSKPLVSVIMPTFNRDKSIAQSIESVLKQTYINFEFIIIDDASTDQTSEIIKHYAKTDPRIISLCNATNLRIQKSLNRGLAQAKGKYIARIDDDDAWIGEEKLQKQIDFLETHPEYVIVGTGNIAIYEAKGLKIKSLKPETDAQIRAAMLLGCPFLHPSVVIRKSALEKVGGIYDQTMTQAEDYDLWMRLGKVGKMHNLPAYSLRSIVGATNMGHLKRKEILAYNLKLIRQYRHDYPGFYLAYIKNWLEYFDARLPVLRIIFAPLYRVRRKILNSIGRKKMKVEKLHSDPNSSF